MAKLLAQLQDMQNNADIYEDDARVSGMIDIIDYALSDIIETLTFIS